MPCYNVQYRCVSTPSRSTYSNYQDKTSLLDAVLLCGQSHPESAQSRLFAGRQGERGDGLQASMQGSSQMMH